ncbi:MAG: hypothetical protein JNJ99_02755 [Crocinitomicaceae bacterium]|nr:hypothetical protein [Crocinitomicaceae bacterium]
MTIFSQEFKKTYLSIENENFKKEHIIKEDKLVRVWVNDSVSYLGFLEFNDSLTINLYGIDDTLIETNDIVKMQARNKRRSVGAVFTIISPALCGVIVDVILTFTDVYGTFTFFPATIGGLVGSSIGVVVVCFTMNRRVYRVEDGVEFKIHTAG